MQRHGQMLLITESRREAPRCAPWGGTTSPPQRVIHNKKRIRKQSNKMNINKFLKSIFGDKASRDMKTIRPLVEKVKAAYPAVKALSNDELRAKTQEIRQQVRDAASSPPSRIRPSTSASLSSTRSTNWRRRPSIAMRRPSTR